MNRLYCMLCAIVFLPGCVPISEPLSDPTKSEPDKDLIGTWLGKKENSSIVIDVPGIKGHPKGIMRIRSTDANNPEPVWFYVTTIGKEKYASWMVSVNSTKDELNFDKDGAFEKWLKDDGKRYLVGHYSVKGDMMTLNAGDEKVYAALLKAAKIETDKFGFPKTPKGWLSEYLAKNGPDAIYPKDKADTFTRMKK